MKLLPSIAFNDFLRLGRQCHRPKNKRQDNPFHPNQTFQEENTSPGYHALPVFRYDQAYSCITEDQRQGMGLFG